MNDTDLIRRDIADLKRYVDGRFTTLEKRVSRGETIDIILGAIWRLAVVALPVAAAFAFAFTH